MRAVGLDFDHRTLLAFDHPEPPAPAPGQVLLRIHEAGVCATDRELARFRFGTPPPGEARLILGHEALAQVEFSHSPLFEKGAWVVPTVRRSCVPACASCAASRRDLCRTGNYTERGIAGLHGYFTELAVDDACDLLAVPDSLLGVAVLAEPMSVAAKAIETALRLHPLAPRTASIAGAGPIGLLLAFALQLRGIDCTVCSLEPEDHPRAQLLQRAGIPYLRNQSPSPADLVFDACGTRADLLEWLAPLGALIFVGASEAPVSLDPLRLLLANQSLAGVINSSPGHFRDGLSDLARIRRPLLDALIERRPFEALPDSLCHGSPVPKLVHTLSTH